MIKISILALLFFISTSIFGQWTTSKLSSSRSLAASVSNGTKIYIGGGANYSLNKAESVVDIYDVNLKEWTKLNLSQPRFVLTAASTDNKVIFAGGVTSVTTAAVSNKVDIYDVNSGAWETASLSQSRGALAGTSNGKKALFGGGIISFISTTTTTKVDIYDETTGAWATDNLSVARGYLSVVTSGNKAYFAGGIERYVGNVGPAIVSNRIDIYDYESGSWSIDSLSVARGGLSAAAVGNKIFFAGGHDPQYNSLDIVDIYDTENKIWTTHNLSQARGELTAVALGNKVFFAGGYSNYNSNTMSDVVDIYDNSTNTWTTAVLSQARSELCSASAGNTLLISAGGSHGSTQQFDTVDIYSETTTGLKSNYEVPNGFKLYNNYPNPFNPTTKIKYEINNSYYVRLKVFDILGKEIRTLVNSYQLPGNYDVEFNADNLSSGLYIYELEADNHNESKIMTLIK